MTSNKLRVGIVNYLNSKPLAWGFLQGLHADRFETLLLPPAQVADRLRSGHLDVGLIPSIEVQRIPGLRVLPGPCIAATQEVRSVLLVSRAPLGEVRRVALDENSRTSVALLRILLAEAYGLHPDGVTMRAELDLMLDDCEAALLIGDPALHVDRSRYLVFDLAAEWRRLTGLPFVFAVWAVAPGVEEEQLERAFDDSLRYGLQRLDELVAATSAELALDASLVRSYLTQSLSFHLGRAQRSGLEEFYRRAARHRLIDAAREIDWAGVAV
jgi:chorismate dehydratase